MIALPILQTLRAGALPSTSYIPFIDPIDAHAWWFLLLLPLAFFISMVYKAIRLGRLDRYWEQVMTMTFLITFGMILAGGAFYVVIQWIVPTILPMPD